MQIMYKGKVNSPHTMLVNAINSTQTSIEVIDSNVLPDAPNICTIGVGVDAETVAYTSIAGNILTVERGFQGVALEWEAGTVVARNFTEYDYEALRSNIDEHLADIANEEGRHGMRYWNERLETKVEGEWIHLKGEKGDPFVYADFTQEQISDLKSNLETAVNEAHNFDNGKTYRWGLKIVNGKTQFMYEEVTE